MACSGICCKFFVIGYESIASLQKMADTNTGDPEAAKIAAMIFPVYSIEKGDGFSCVHWNKVTKLCMDYANRPKMCSDYPYTEHCIWCGDAGPSREPIALIGG